MITFWLVNLGETISPNTQAEPPDRTRLMLPLSSPSECRSLRISVMFVRNGIDNEGKFVGDYPCMGADESACIRLVSGQ